MVALKVGTDVKTAVVANCGPKGVSPRGAWRKTTNYLSDDLVTFAGSSWRATVPSKGKRPDRSASFWEKFAAKGARGQRGLAGETGPQGDIGPAGATGSQGPQGVAGEPGLQGETGPQGEKGLRWRGEWDAGTTYAVDDAVHYLGDAFIAVPDGGTYAWSLLAAKGDAGSAGSSCALSPPLCPLDGIATMTCGAASIQVPCVFPHLKFQSTVTAAFGGGSLPAGIAVEDTVVFVVGFSTWSNAAPAPPTGTGCPGSTTGCFEAAWTFPAVEYSLTYSSGYSQDGTIDRVEILNRGCDPNIVPEECISESDLVIFFEGGNDIYVVQNNDGTWQTDDITGTLLAETQDVTTPALFDITQYFGSWGTWGTYHYDYARPQQNTIVSRTP